MQINVRGAIGGGLMAALVVVSAWAPTATAAVIQFQEDISPDGAYQTTATYIRSNTADPGSNSEGSALQIGRTATAGDFIRSIVGFDLSAIPAGSTINSVTLTISPRHNDANSTDQAFAVNVYRLSSDAFTETSVTWWRRDVTDAGTLWTTPGGDYDSTVLSSASINGKTWANGAALAPTNPASDVQVVFGSTSAWVAAAQAALDGGSALNMLLASPEIEGQDLRSIIQIASDDPITSASGSNRKTVQSQAPMLTIDYTPVPEPTSLALAGLALTAFARRRRNAA